MGAEVALLQEELVDIRRKVSPSPAWWELGGTTEGQEGHAPGAQS